MDLPVRGEAEFTERMEYLADAIKKMINDLNTARETQRLQHLNIQEGPSGWFSFVNFYLDPVLEL
jgi:hypothetical protein